MPVFCEIPGGNVLCVAGLQLLHEAVLQTEIEHVFANLVVFRLRNGPFQLVHALDVPHGQILGHEADPRPGQVFRNPGERLFGIFHLSRQNQVPHDEPGADDPLRIQFHRPHLPEHFLQSRGGELKIIPRPGISGGQIGRNVFQIRQIHLHPALHGPQGFHPLVAAAVPHHGQPVPSLQRIINHPGPVGGVHQIQIVHAPVRQGVINFPQPGNGDGFAEILPGNFHVLTEPAAQGASGEKHRAGAPGAGNHRLLVVMGGRPGDSGRVAHAAEAFAPGHAAAPGTQIAQFSHGFPHLRNVPQQFIIHKKRPLVQKGLSGGFPGRQTCASAPAPPGKCCRSPPPAAALPAPAFPRSAHVLRTGKK